MVAKVGVGLFLRGIGVEGGLSSLNHKFITFETFPNEVHCGGPDVVVLLSLKDADVVEFEGVRNRTDFLIFEERREGELGSRGEAGSHRWSTLRSEIEVGEVDILLFLLWRRWSFRSPRTRAHNLLKGDSSSGDGTAVEVRSGSEETSC